MTPNHPKEALSFNSPKERVALLRKPPIRDGQQLAPGPTEDLL